MKSWLSWFLIVVGIGLVALIGYSFVPSPQDVDLATVERGTIRVTVDEDGKTRIHEKYVVSTPLAGRLLRIDMEPGDQVTSGETLLATIEPRDPELLDARAVAQAEARVRAAEAALKKTEPLLQQARIEQGNAETDFGRIRRAHAGGALTPADLDDAVARYHSTSELLRSAKFAQEIAQFELQQAEAALVRSRPRKPEDSADSEDNHADETKLNGWNFTIRAPITGRVLRVFQESSSVVTAGMSLLELGDPDDLEVEVDVLSSDAVKIQPGALVLLEHWGGDNVLRGKVRLVEPSGYTKLSTLGVEEQRVNVIVDLTDPMERRQSLGDGFRVEARIVVAEVDNVLKVPASSLFRVQEKWAVFLAKENRAVETIVTIGHHNGLEAEITQGLSEGDQVVTHPSDHLSHGTAIRQR